MIGLSVSSFLSSPSPSSLPPLSLFSAKKRTKQSNRRTEVATRRRTDRILLVLALASYMNVATKILPAARGLSPSTMFATRISPSVARKSSTNKSYTAPTAKLFVCFRSLGTHSRMTISESDGNQAPIDDDDDSGANLVGDVVESMLNRASRARATSASLSSAPSETSSRNNDDDGIAEPFQALFRSTLRRAYSTRATLDDVSNNQDGQSPAAASRARASAAVASILDATIVETQTTKPTSEPSKTNSRESIADASNALIDDTLANAQQKSNTYARRSETKKQRQTQEHRPKKSKPPSTRYEFPFSTSYKSHPALNNVALAQALWASVVRTNVDSVIDTTCGNGNDSIVLAEILFGENQEKQQATSSELVCVDVQSLACERTRRALQEVLPPSIRVVTGDGEEEDNNNRCNPKVRVLQASHEQLPRPTNTSSVGLIVYNLGWLPGSNNNNTGDDDSPNGKDCMTTMETTLASLVDATSLLRVGGMLSVMTYPRSGPDEDVAVKLFVTCLGLLSSRTQTWREAIAAFESFACETEPSDRKAIAALVTASMESVVAREEEKTWRVSQHDKLGVDRPPVLFTAVRIK